MFCTKCGAQNADDLRVCAACGADLPQQPQPTQMQPPIVAAPKTSPMAIWSLVLGILGFCTCITAVPGLILGIIGMKQCNEKPNEFTGKGLALAGIILSVVAMIISLLLSAVLFPVFNRARHAAGQADCQANVRQLGTSIKMYLTDWDDTYPPAASWCDATKDYAKNPNAYVCGAAKDKACGYAFSAALGGQPEGVVRSAFSTPLVFESDRGWNGSGGRDAMITQPRHMFINVGCADTHVQPVFAGTESTLQWNP